MSTTDIPPGVHKLKLGTSFIKDSGQRYHTVRYDFKPASVEDCDECYVELGPKAEATVSIPKIDSSDNVKDVTLFKGSRKPNQKECLLIYDHDTGEFTLEELNYNVQVKQVRSGEEEREKNVAYVREIRDRFKKCTDLFNKRDQQPSSALQQDVLMSDEEDQEDSSTSSSSESDDQEEDRSKKAKVVTPKVKNGSKRKSSTSNNEESSDEDDIAKSLEAVVATTSAVKLSPSKQNSNLPAHSTSLMPAAAAADTLHDDLQLSDSSEEDT